VPVHLREVVATALAKDPAQRFSSMADFASALRGGPIVVGAAAAASELPAPPAEVAADAPDATRILTAVGAAAVPPPGTPPPATSDRRRPAWLPWAGAALGVLLVVLLLAWLTRGEEPATTASTGSEEPVASASLSASSSPSAKPSKAAAIVIDAGDYVGLPKDEAKSRLEDLGLKVKETKLDNVEGHEENTVADIDPTGRVREGTEITLSVWGKPVVAVPEPKPGHGDKGKGHKKKGH
jgi:serine/threonine-protein kinase